MTPLDKVAELQNVVKQREEVIMTLVSEVELLHNIVLKLLRERIDNITKEIKKEKP